jgi:hypothetical protein
MSGASVSSIENRPAQDEALVALATQAATDAGQQIAANCQGLTRRERLHVSNAFRRQLIPPGKPGRKRSSKITAAYMDWKEGVRGVALYRKHILGWDRHNYWRRKVESRALMDAIHTRERREGQTQRLDVELG